MARLTAFISYAHAPQDERIAAWLARLLEASEVDVWWDSLLKARAGPEMNKEICDRLDAADYVFAVVSSMSLSSSYCRAELVRSIAAAKPLVRIDVEPVAGSAPPPELLPLLGETEAVANLAGADENAWPQLLAEAAARRGLMIRATNIEAMSLSADIRVIRPNYFRLRSGNAREWDQTLARLSAARALSPANGYGALNLALLRVHLGQADLAAADATEAMRNLPRSPDAYFAAALAACARQKWDRRAKPETDAILDLLSTGRRLGGGAHLYLLASCVISNFYIARYLTPPEQPLAVLGAGRSAIFDREENARAWDVEPMRTPPIGGEMNQQLQAYGVV